MRDLILNNLKQLLSQAVKEVALFGSLIVSQEGLPITNSDQIDPKIEIEVLAAKVATYFDEGGIISEIPNEILFSFPGKKIFIIRIPSIGRANDSMLLITIIPNTIRFFKRNIKKIVKQIRGLFNDV